MGRQFLIIFILLVFALRSFSQVQTTDAVLRETVKNQGQVEVTVPFIDRASTDLLTRNVSILSVRNGVILVSLSPVTVEWFINQNFPYRIAPKRLIKGLISSTSPTGAMQWDSYPSYTQYDSIMRSFVTSYPALCRLDTIGTSIKGKLVLALKITGTATGNNDKPEVFYSSTIHGDETGGFILMLHLIDYLLKNYQGDNRVKTLMDNLEIWINPLSNPDGTYNHGDTINSPTRYNANGFDLNRNFPDPITPTTVKQKETLDMVKFMRKHRFVISANFHSGSELVNYPWDRWLLQLHADDVWFNGISRAYADTAHVYAGPAYMNEQDNGVTRGAVWYIIYGGRQDFITWELQGREVTIELDDQYITPAVQLPLLWENNRRSLLGYLENALYGIHGLVLDSTTSKPVKAEVFIKGHDVDSSQVYSDSLSGRFTRFLAPGTWNLTFSAKGYHDTTISNVIVAQDQKTNLEVKMVPITGGIDTSHTIPPALYPNPAAGEIKAILPHQITGRINIKIYNMSGMLITDYNTIAVEGIPLLIDLKGFDNGTYIIVFTSKSKLTSGRGRFVVVK